MTTDEAIDLLERKLKRRRHLNDPGVRRARGAVTSVPTSISLTFAEVEAIITALDEAPSSDEFPQ